MLPTERPALQPGANLTYRRRASGAELMDHDGRRGHGDFHRLAHRGFPGQRGGKVGGDGVAGTDDVDGPAHGQGGDMLRFAGGRGAEDAAFGQRDENPAALLARQGHRDPLEFVEGQVLFSAGESGQFGGVHFENHRRKPAQTPPAVGDNEQPLPFPADGIDRLQHFARHRAGFRRVHLIQENESVCLRQLEGRIDDLALDKGRSRRPVFAVESIELFRRPVGVH